MPNLFPAGYQLEVLTADDLIADKPIGYRSGAAFDYGNGDFKRDGGNKILSCSGVESWKAWCINTFSTQRYSRLAYNTDIGIDYDSIFASESREEAESRLTRELTEAALADPYGRTEYVEAISYTWNAPDSVTADVCLHGIDDVTIDIQVSITNREG